MSALNTASEQGNGRWVMKARYGRFGQNHLAKVRVAGSSPVARSGKPPAYRGFFDDASNRCSARVFRSTNMADLFRAQTRGRGRSQTPRRED
jgi:hypothetical protein